MTPHMIHEPHSPQAPVVLRQTGAVVAAVAVWVFCGLATLDAALEGTVGFAVHVGAVMLLVAYATWMLLASPCLVVSVAGLRVVNPLRRHEVPFGALVHLRVRGLTSLEVRRGPGRSRTVTSWNAPGAARGPADRVSVVSVAVERFLTAWEREHAPSDDTFATTSWRWPQVLLLAALVTLNISIG